jgi:excisionase family DNA binding protein
MRIIKLTGVITHIKEVNISMPANTEVTRRTYNAQEVATILGVSLPVVYSLIASEGFPSIRVGGGRRIVVPCDAFDRWMEAASKAPKQ